MSQPAEGKILVVDDEPLILVLLEEIVHRCGYEAVTASNGFEGVRAAARNEPICLVITDIQMPKLGGIELIHSLRKKSPNLPAILISGCCADFHLVQQQLNDLTFFVEKPFGFQKLSQAIETVMAIEEGTTEPSRTRLKNRGFAIPRRQALTRQSAR